MDKKREKLGALSGACGVGVNVLLCIAKIAAGLIFASVSVIADGINNLTDALSSFLTFIAFKLSAKPADKDHPFGHQRYEYIFGLFISLIIVALGGILLKSSVEKILNPGDFSFDPLIAIILAVSIIAKLIMFFFYKKIARIINSVTVAAAGQDSLNDVISSSAVLLALIIGNISGLVLDGYIGILVSLFIVYSGIKMVIETLNPIIGEMPDTEIALKLCDKVQSYDGVIGIHDLMMHSYGPETVFATLHAEVPAEEDIMVSHDIIDNIENEIWNDMHIHLTIHLDPVVTSDSRITDAKNTVCDIVKNISPTLNIHDFRAVFGVTHNNYIFDLVVPFDYKGDINMLSDEIKSKVSETIPNGFAVINIDREYVKR